MISKIKKWLYFPIAYYFRIFAKIQLLFWHPKIIAITGSNGKTTLLHLLESQIGNKAHYSHKANSTYGIPFDILGLKRKTLDITEWVYLFLFAPLRAFKKPYGERLYVVEADCDRPSEGKFLATLLKPHITVWLSCSRTHTMNFGKATHGSVDEEIAHEFGYFAEYTQNIVITNGDSTLISQQLNRTKSLHKIINKDDHLKIYKIENNKTIFNIDNKTYSFNFFLPEESFYAIAATTYILEYLKIPLDASFGKFNLPAGRSSVFRGIKGTTIIDSTYNATPASMSAILKMFTVLPASKKWLVLGDMIDLGNEEPEEHEKLAKIIISCNAEKTILVGPRLAKYTYPKLSALEKNNSLLTFMNPKEALDHLNADIKGKETILFKGARFLEGIIEHLLRDKNDIEKLPRREKAWQIRRKKWGL